MLIGNKSPAIMHRHILICLLSITAAVGQAPSPLDTFGTPRGERVSMLALTGTSPTDIDVMPHNTKWKCPAGTDIEDHRCLRRPPANPGPDYRIVCTTLRPIWYADNGCYKEKLSYVQYDEKCPSLHVCIPLGTRLKSKRRRNDKRPPTRIACVLRSLVANPPGRPPKHKGRLGSSVEGVVAAIDSASDSAPGAGVPATDINSPAAEAINVQQDDDSLSWLDNLEDFPELYVELEPSLELELEVDPAPVAAEVLQHEEDDLSWLDSMEVYPELYAGMPGLEAIGRWVDASAVATASGTSASTSAGGIGAGESQGP